MLLFLWGPSLCCLLIHSRILVSAVPADCDRPCPKEPQVNKKGKIIFTDDPQKKCQEEIKKCKRCANQKSGVECEDVVARLKKVEVLQTPKEASGILRPMGCTEEKADSDACKINGGSSRRKKRGFPGGGFHPKYVWHQDKLPKNRQACLTTKRVIHYVTDCGKDCYPVYCPLAGGHQFIDEVVCNVTVDNYEEYQATQLSQPKTGTCGMDGNTPCSISYTLRTYLVTNVPPMGWWGHCLFEWVPVWFQNVKVPTHCYCKYKREV